MKILVLGGVGRIGTAIAHDLAGNDKVSQVGITGLEDNRLEQVKSDLGKDKVNTHKIDLEDNDKVIAILKDYDLGIVALPNRRLSYKAIECGIKAEKSMVDILEEYHRRPESHEIEGIEIPAGKSLQEYGEDLHIRAEKAGITILDGMGFAPGLSNITTQAGIDHLDSATSAIARVGGIPSRDTSARHPLKYLVTWSFEHVLREYMVEVTIRKGGKVTQVQALDEHEIFDFDHFGIHEKLECFITPGMPSYIFTHPELDYFTEKTIRWPGHRQGIQTLKECGLLDIEPRDFMGTKISPREFMLSQLEPRLRPQKGDTDACVMYNTIDGIKANQQTRVEFFLWDTEDSVTGFTSMARVTGFSAAIAGVMLGQNSITKTGIVAPEEAITGKLYENFISELAKRNIKVEMSIS